ncbi:S-adenosyl-L-methionine-dependent methyltransferase [Xylaria arbuscula]|nr:S-adenosyl-L-methionine-dependent methyltransferase [Xylaria arbuscula]
MADTTQPLLARTSEAFMGLLYPWLFLKLSLSFLPATISHILHTQESLPSALRLIFLSPSRFREAWFGQFWTVAGPQVRESAKARVLPLLDGRTTQGRVTDRPTGPGIGDVCMEIGPGSGLWVDIFSNRHLLQSSADRVGGSGEEGKEDTAAETVSGTARSEITRVYGVEPNAAHHPALRRAVEDAGLKGIYEIVPVGIEDLSSSSGDSDSDATLTGRRKKWEGSIAPGSIDCIVSVLCLCSIPDPKQHIHELYELLRPGGRWYVYEHVLVRYSWYMRLYQRKFSPVIFPSCLIAICALLLSSPLSFSRLISLRSNRTW